MPDLTFQITGVEASSRSRNRLWTHVNATVGMFRGSTDIRLLVPCSFDLNLAAAKYFYALEQAEIPLLFLFSGSVFYANGEGRAQDERISWNKECAYRIPAPILPSGKKM